MSAYLRPNIHKGGPEILDLSITYIMLYLKDSTLFICFNCFKLQSHKCCVYFFLEANKGGLTV
jgi:hypothetical protein